MKRTKESYRAAVVGKTRDDDAKDDEAQAKVQATEDTDGHLESEPSRACRMMRMWWWQSRSQQQQQQVMTMMIMMKNQQKKHKITKDKKKMKEKLFKF